jgi:MraZ protein
MEFFDQFEHTIDDKGRLVLPAAYRSAFADGGFVTFMGHSVGLFTEEGFEKHRRKLSLSDTFSRRDLSQVMALTTPFTPDSQHRISIGPKLRTRVGLEREVSIVGQGSHAAIFPRSVWETQEAAADVPDESGLALADKFDELGFL